MGKIEKFRECPAVGRRIKPIECGQNRGKNYACPAECSYCPWTVANYDDFLEIEGAVDTKTLEFYIGVAGKFAARTNLNIEALHEDGEQIFQGNCYREYYQREHKPGKRLFDLWRESGWAGLVRDEPFVAGFKAGTRIALLECRSVVDDLRVECVDLLDEQADVITVCDRGLAKTALQFQCFIGWVAKYPFFSRMHGIGYPLPAGSEPGLELVRRHVRDMGGPHDRPELMAGWLGENFVAFMDRVGEESRMTTKAMFLNTDFKESELGLGELKTPSRPASSMVLDTGWWEEIPDEETIAERLQNGIEDPESCLSLRDFPELDEYFESIDSDLLNTKELDSLILMVNLAIGAFVPKGVRPRQIGLDEMYRETKAIYLQIMPEDLSVSQVGDAFDDLMDVSVQPAFLSFAGRALVAMTSAGKILGFLPFGKRVTPDNIVPILVQIEAFLRCLRRSSLG